MQEEKTTVEQNRVGTTPAPQTSTSIPSADLNQHMDIVDEEVLKGAKPIATSEKRPLKKTVYFLGIQSIPRL